MKVSTVLIGLILMVCSFANILFAQPNAIFNKDTIENFSTGKVNWTQGRILASGIGVPNPNLPLAASRATARRAATLVARRNLLELTNGIRVDSETTVQNFLVKSDRIQTKISGLIKGATVENIEEYAHGGIEITLSMPLWGNDSLGLALLEESDTPNTAFHQSEEGAEYTGVIIDARRLGLKPAIFPKILEEDGQIIYGRKTPSKHALEIQGFVQYETIPPLQKTLMHWWYSDQIGVFRIENSTPAVSRVGRRPIRIKGLRIQGTLKTNVIISKEDAEKIKQTPSLLKALQKANLVIITDPLIAGIQGNSKKGFIYRASTF